MQITPLDLLTLSQIKTQWLSQIENLEAEKSKVDFIVWAFDLIEKNDSLGKFEDNVGRSTYLSVNEIDTQECVALIDVVFTRKGRICNIKLLKVVLSPAIDKLDDDAYHAKHIDIWFNVIVQLLASMDNTIGGTTKFFASTVDSVNYIKHIHDSADDEKLRELGLEISFEGRQWLTFKKI